MSYWYASFFWMLQRMGSAHSLIDTVSRPRLKRELLR